MDINRSRFEQLNLLLDNLELKAQELNEILNQNNKPKYKHFSNAEEFIELSGLSKDDFEKKVAKMQEFKKFIYKFEDSRKRYIKTKPALEFIENNLMTAESDL
ncbi:hypothetical protein FH144_08025 [Staphylococcus caledonicus]|uniref:hypothetical protein n=1 Tax=Staphylococcus sp. acrmy TaxID=2929076 RepID=UPI001F582DB4|nr:hypothetical protein [Staphylococcus sp. acrmy]MCI2948373.1 hypothetical protein [Staphylococcus sp. acrmy]